MTILEALLAVVIALGVVASAIEASQIAISRSVIARLLAESALDAEALLSRVGNDIPFDPGHIEGAEANGARWSLDIVTVSAGNEALRAYQVTSDVSITRAGRSVHSEIATLKLQWGTR
jgi:acyl CoA:acetate/3-ketoacid CoA transferase